MSAPDGGALAAVASIPRDESGPVFPAPWAARAFALAVALEERGVFAWSEWSQTLGPEVAGITAEDAADPEAYWRAWLAALETILRRRQLTEASELLDLKEAWRRASETTPHGQPIELPALRYAASDPTNSTAPSAVMNSAASSSSPSMT